MQFFRPENFAFLWTLPLIVLAFWMSGALRKKRIAKFGNAQLVETKLMPNYKSSEKRLRAFYFMMAFLLAVMALARPQWGEEKKTIQRKGVDVIFLLDTSLSMMAEDAKPNRLEKSKMEIKSLVQVMKGDRVGIVAFAGTGFLQAPLTLDYAAFFLFLDAIKTGYIPDPGTSLDRALMIAAKSFSQDALKHKAVILFSDGEDHEGGIDDALKELKKNNVRVYALGVGSENGEPIPLKDEKGNRSGFKKDRQGSIVITKLNKQLLGQIASETGGVYLPSTPGEQEIDLVMKHMGTLDKTKFQEKEVTEKEDHYQIFLFFAFLFLILEMLIRKTVKVKGIKLLPIIALFFLTSGFLKTTKSLSDEGGKLYENKQYQSSLDAYRKAQVKNPEDPAVRYNLAAPLYQLQNYQEASKQLEKAVANAKDNKELQAKALYNYGNTLYRLGNFEKAIESYKKALELNPEDKDAKYNLEFLQKQKSLFDKKNDEKKKEDQNKQEKNQPKPSQQNQKNQQQQQQQQQKQDQQQNQQQQQKQDQQQDQQKDQQPQDQQQNKDDQQKDQQNQNQDQNQDKDQDQKQNQGEPKEDKPEQNQPDKGSGDQDQKQDQQDKQEQNQQASPQEDQDQNQQDQPQPKEDEQQRSAAKPLQGQMSMQNALQVLDALKESEKELQDLRKPPVKPNATIVDKDW